MTGDRADSRSPEMELEDVVDHLSASTAPPAAGVVEESEPPANGGNEGAADAADETVAPADPAGAHTDPIDGAPGPGSDAAPEDAGAADLAPDAVAAEATGAADLEKPMYFPGLIARRPYAVCCSTVLVALGLAVLVVVAVPLLLASEGNFYTRSSRIAKEFDAWDNRFVDNESLSAQQERAFPAFDLFLYFETRDGSTILTAEHLERIREIEALVIEEPEFQSSFCQVDPVSGTCLPPTSLTNFYFEDGAIVDDVDGKTLELAGLVDAGFPVSFFFESGFSVARPESFVTRTHISFGGPLEGYDNVDDKPADQLDDLADFIVDYVDVFADASDDQLRLTYLGAAITDAALVAELWADIQLAMAAIGVVFGLLWLETWSFFLALMGIVQMLLSVPIALALYRFVFFFEWSTSLNLMSLFLSLGISSDDQLVMVDHWKAAEKDFPDPVMRMSHVWRKAGAAMATTTLTTFAAFMATTLSGIPTLIVFGVFSSGLILATFALVMTFYASVLVIWSRNFAHTCVPGLHHLATEPPSSSDKPEAEAEGGTESMDGAPELDMSHFRVLERFFYNDLAPVLRRFRFALLAAALVLAIGASVGASFLVPPNVPELNIPSGNPARRALNLEDEVFPPSTLDPTTPLVYMVFGIETIDRSGLDINDPNRQGKTVFQDDFFMASVEGQEAFVESCATVAENREIVLDGEVLCFVELFWAWREEQGLDPVADDPDEFHASLAEFRVNGTDEVSHLFNFRLDGSLQFAAIEFKSVLPVIPGRELLNEQFSIWENENDARNLVHPATMQSYQTTDSWVFMHTQDKIFEVAINGLIVGLALAFAVMFIMTGNFLVALCGLLSLGLISSGVMAILVVGGFNLGITESLSLIILAGLSVDQPLHIAVAFVHSKHESSYARVRQALLELGISLLGGAMTTIASASLFWFAEFPIFFRFAVTITSVIALSFVTAVTMLPALLMVVAPGPKRGNVVPILQWVWGMMRGTHRVMPVAT